MVLEKGFVPRSTPTKWGFSTFVASRAEVKVSEGERGGMGRRSDAPSSLTLVGVGASGGGGRKREENSPKESDDEAKRTVEESEEEVRDEEREEEEGEQEEREEEDEGRDAGL